MRRGEKQVLDGARRDLEAVAVAMTARLASARERDDQTMWLRIAAFGVVVAGAILSGILTGPIARELPPRWQLPARFAANTMGTIDPRWAGYDKADLDVTVTRLIARPA